jgi:PAS domain S-box-containing protein
MNSESASSIDLELQRLHRWLSLLEQWSDGLRSAPEALALAQLLCRLLVDAAHYAQAEVALALPDGILVSASTPHVEGAESLRDIHFPVEWHGQPLGALRLWADAHAPERADEHRFISRMLGDLVKGVMALAAPQGAPPPNSRLELLSLAVEQSSFAIVVTDIHGQVQYANPSFTAMTGYTLADIADVPAFQWNLAGNIAEIYHGLLALPHPGERWQGDTLNRRKDGSLYWERQVASTLRDGLGRATHLVVVKEDITDIKGLHQAAEQTQLLHEQALASSSNGIMITRSDDNDHSSASPATPPKK